MKNIALKSLIPLLSFILLYLGVGTYLHLQGEGFAFYQLPSPIAILPAIIIAFLILPKSFNEKLQVLFKGMGDENIITMCMIYLLAGAFAQLAKSSGAVESMVNLGLTFIPASFILPGIFTIASFVSIAMGTSMGTIAAVAPIALGIAQQADLSIGLCLGAVIGGAMFGDNLSFISDTTIAATRTQNCNMKEKFSANIKMALPAAILAIALYFSLGQDLQNTQIGEYSLVKTLPYIAIFVLSITGMNVFSVLLIGIISSIAVLFVTTADFSLLKAGKEMYQGYLSMIEIFLLSMMIGGLAQLSQHFGGQEWIAQKLQSLIAKFPSAESKVAELGIAALVFIVNLGTANNTVSILVVGDICRKISQKFKIPAAQSASLIDVFSCVCQGIIPYGAQVLLACSLAKISPFEILGQIYYCYILAIIAIFSIVLKKTKNSY